MSQTFGRLWATERGEAMSSIELSISCTDCVRRSTPDCSDCLVSFVLGGEPETLTMTSEMADVAVLLNANGMIPRLKFHREAALASEAESSRS
jgi:hypothetical protein